MVYDGYLLKLLSFFLWRMALCRDRLLGLELVWRRYFASTGSWQVAPTPIVNILRLEDHSNLSSRRTQIDRHHINITAGSPGQIRSSTRRSPSSPLSTAEVLSIRWWPVPSSEEYQALFLSEYGYIRDEEVSTTRLHAIDAPTFGKRSSGISGPNSSRSVRNGIRKLRGGLPCRWPTH